jgi:hypothetical protein
MNMNNYKYRVLILMVFFSFLVNSKLSSNENVKYEVMLWELLRNKNFKEAYLNALRKIDISKTEK